MDHITTGAVTAEEWGAVFNALKADVQALERRHEAACARLSSLRRSGTLLARLGLETMPLAVTAAIEAAQEAGLDLVEIVQTAHEAEIAHSQALSVCVSALHNYRRAYFAVMGCMPPIPSLEQLVAELERSAAATT